METLTQERDEAQTLFTQINVGDVVPLNAYRQAEQRIARLTEALTKVLRYATNSEQCHICRAFGRDYEHGEHCPIPDCVAAMASEIGRKRGALAPPSTPETT